jgi:hypothetical protein
MSHLKSLTLTVAPHQIERNPKLLRRQRLIERLEEQQKLAADPTFTVLVRRWIKDLDGVKQPFDRQKRVKPWWKADGAGNLVLVLKNGLKTLEVEKGKPGIVVGPVGRLETVLSTLIAAAKAGELDGALEAASGSGDGRGVPGRAKAA